MKKTKKVSFSESKIKILGESFKIEGERTFYTSGQFLENVLKEFKTDLDTVFEIKKDNKKITWQVYETKNEDVILKAFNENSSLIWRSQPIKNTYISRLFIYTALMIIGTGLVSFGICYLLR